MYNVYYYTRRMDLNLEADVLKHLPTPESAAAVRALVEHPRNALSLSTGQHGYRYLDVQSGQYRAVRGLTTVLEEYFWSQTMPAARGPAKPVQAPPMSLWDRRRLAAAKRAAAAATRAAKAAARVSHRGIAGHVRGSLVHGQVHDFFTLDRRSFQRRNGSGAHPWAAMAVTELLKRDKLPVASEFIVWNEQLRVGTAIDFIAVDKATGTLEFYELKTGYAAPGEWTRSVGPMRGPLAGVLEDTPRNRAVVQIVAGALLAIVGHQVTARFACYVMHVNGAGVDFLRVDPAFVDAHSERLWAALRAG